MKKIQSKDGTSIAVDRTGSGPALVFVDGAMCYRASGPSQSMAAALADHFTVFTYDRRGRGDSSDTSSYDVQREVDDLEAVIREAGGQALVFGVSSGAALALEAATRGVPITRLALYEAPFIVDDSRSPLPDDFGAHGPFDREAHARSLQARLHANPRMLAALGAVSLLLLTLGIARRR